MNFSKKILSIPLILIYAFFCFLMLQITLQYPAFETDVAFLRIKQEEMELSHYPIAFFVHVYTSMFVLLAGFTQFSKNFQRKFPLIHKRMGWIYIATILLFSGPSGLVLGIHANGGWSSQLAFCLLALLWIGFTWLAFQKIRKGDILGHQKFMYRSFALTMSAITLRAWKYILVAIFQPKPMDVYRWVAWLGWVVNLIIVEIIIFKKFR